MRATYIFDMGVIGRPTKPFSVMIEQWSSDEKRAYCAVEEPFEISGEFATEKPVTNGVLTPFLRGSGRQDLEDNKVTGMVFCGELCPSDRSLKSWLDSKQHFKNAYGLGVLRIG